MAAEYAARMQQLRLQRQEAAGRRSAIEKKLVLREATAAEFSAVALQSARQRVKSLKAAAAAARKRNDAFVRAVREAQRRVEDARLQVLSERAPASVALEREKARYLRKIEQAYPTWQEKEQRMRIDKLRALEDRKRQIEQRRFLARKTFEQEQTIEDLIRQTRHEIELSENLAQNEAYERELLRHQSLNHAAEVKQTIREQARDARSYLQAQASNELLTTPGVDDQTSDAIYEAFSPRSALQALREGTNIVSMRTTEEYGNDENELEQRQQLEVSVSMPQSLPCTQYGLHTIQEGDESQISGPTIYSTPNDFHVNRSGPPPLLKIETKHPSTHMQVSMPHPIQQQQMVRQKNDQQNEVQSSAQNLQNCLPIEQELKKAPYFLSTVNTERTKEATVEEKNESGNTGQHLDLQGHSSDSPFMQDSAKTTYTVLLSDASIRKSEEITPSFLATGLHEFISDPQEFKHESQEIAVSSFIPSAEPRTVANSALKNDLVEKITETRPSVSPDDKQPSVSPTDNVTSHILIERETGVGTHQIPQVGQTLPTVVAEDIVRSDTKHTIEVQDSIRDNMERAASSPDDPTTQSPVPMLPPPAPSPEMASTGADSIQLSPLTSLELSGSFFRDVESKVVPTPLPIEIVESIESTQVNPTPNLATALSQDSEVVLPSPPIDLQSELHESVRDEALPVVIQDVGASPNYQEKYQLEPSDTTSGTPSNDQDITTQSSPVAREIASRSPDDTKASATERSSDIVELDTSKSPPASQSSLPPTSIEISGIANQSPLSVPVINESANTVEKESPGAVSQVENVTLLKKSPTENMSATDRVKALTALIARVEEGATEGDQFGGSMTTDTSNESKRDLVRTAVSGRKAQIAFYGSDICFELILDIARDIGAVLFPSRAFEGIMNEQKLRKLHQQSKEKEMDIWKLFSNHMKQLVTLKAIATGDLVELFLGAFLSQDPNNQRSQRKMREFLYAACGATLSESPSRKDSFASPTSSPNRLDPGSGPTSPDYMKPTATVEETKPQETRINTPSVLQTAFLQQQSPSKSKSFGIATSGYKKKAGREDDFLSSMGSTPTRLSQKLIKGGKLGDYSEFEEEDEVDLQNLIGSRSARTPVVNRSETPSAAPSSSSTTTSARPTSSFKSAAASRRDDDFDVDF